MLSELTMRIRTLVSRVPRGHQPALDGERADPGEDVAAVLPVADRGLVHAELQEQVVDVGVGVLRRRRRRRPCWSAGARRRARRSAAGRACP